MSIVILVLVIAGAIYYFGFTPQGRKQLEKAKRDYEQYYRTKGKIFTGMEGFDAKQVIFSVNNKTGVAIDDHSKSICLLSNPTGFFPCDTRKIQRLIVPYRDVLEVGLYEDGNSLTKTSRTSQVAGAIVGTVLLGGVGLIIGAFTGAKKTSNTVQSLEVRLTINNTQSPFWAFTFLGSETQKNKAIYKRATQGANRLLSLLKVLIKQADDDDRIAEAQRINQPALPAEQKSSQLDLAKQGNSKAIGALINQSLGSKGIVAKVKLQGDKLQVSLAAQTTPPEKSLVPFIHRGIMSLDIDSVQVLEITGYELGESTPTWAKVLYL